MAMQILEVVKKFFEGLFESGKKVLDDLFPPEKRAEWLARFQQFVVSNPKLSGFLLTNLALSGLPLFVFAAFTLTVFVFSLLAAILIGLLVALLFTLFMVGVALLFVFPLVFFTTLASSFIFLWGLGGYYIVKWFNERDDTIAPKGFAVGDQISRLTGGRLDWVMNATRANAADEDLSTKMGHQHGAPKKLKYQEAENKKSSDDNDTSSKAGDKSESKPPKLSYGGAQDTVTNGAKKGSETLTNGVKKGPGGAVDTVTSGTNQVQKGVDTATKASGVDTATKATGLDTVTKKATGATGTVNSGVGAAKGYVGSATGLT